MEVSPLFPFSRFILTGTRKHILHDLEPYVCTYDKCTEPDRMYDDREAWFNHESQHYSAYFCGVPAHQNHGNLISFCDHMSSVHSTFLGHNGDMSKWEIFLRRVRRLTGQCSLCGQQTNHLKHHTGHHLERISLFAIPKTDLTEDAGAEQLGVSDVSVGNFQGSNNTSSRTDSRLHFGSDTSSIGNRNLESSDPAERSHAPAFSHYLTDDVFRPRAFDASLSVQIPNQLERNLRGVLFGRTPSIEYGDESKSDWVTVCNLYLAEIQTLFQGPRGEEGKEAEWSLGTALLSFYRVARAVVGDEEVVIAADGVTYVLLFRLIVHFIHIIQNILEPTAGTSIWSDKFDERSAGSFSGWMN